VTESGLALYASSEIIGTPGHRGTDRRHGGKKRYYVCGKRRRNPCYIEISSKEWKYLVKGLSLTGHAAITVIKLAPTGKLIIITVYVE
jgi:hypothetical protein